MAGFLLILYMTLTCGCVCILLGQLYRLTNDPQHYNNGLELFDEIQTIAEDEKRKNSALSTSYK